MEKQELLLQYKGEAVGHVRIGAGEGQLTTEVSMPLWEDGIYRVTLVGDSGELPLGILAPEGTRLSLHRRVYKRDLLALGGHLRGEVCRKRRFQEEMDWQEKPSADALPGGELLGNVGRVFWKQEGEGVWLAIPWREDSAFPAPALFCLARVEKVAGERCAVWKFSREGRPEWPE